MRALPLLCVAVSGLQPSTRRQFVAGTTSTALAPAAAMARDLQFKDLGDGLTVAQITEGRGDAAGPPGLDCAGGARGAPRGQAGLDV